MKTKMRCRLVDQYEFAIWRTWSGNWNTIPGIWVPVVPKISECPKPKQTVIIAKSPPQPVAKVLISHTGILGLSMGDTDNLQDDYPILIHTRIIRLRRRVSTKAQIMTEGHRVVIHLTAKGMSSCFKKISSRKRLRRCKEGD